MYFMYVISLIELFNCTNIYMENIKQCHIYACDIHIYGYNMECTWLTIDAIYIHTDVHILYIML